MNWGCLIKHKWEYKCEEIVHLTLAYRKISIPTKVRLCQRCDKKQRSRGVFRNSIDWEEWPLTLEEKRNIKLRNILNND